MASKSVKEETPSVHFFGDPAHLKGEVKLKNKSKKLQKRFMLNFKSKELYNFHGSPVKEIKIRKKLDVGEEAHHNLSLSLSPHTKAGQYEVQAEIDGVTTHVYFDIIEKISAEITPKKAYIEAKPGDEITKRFFLINKGNRPVFHFSCRISFCMDIRNFFKF